MSHILTSMVCVYSSTHYAWFSAKKIQDKTFEDSMVTGFFGIYQSYTVIRYLMLSAMAGPSTEVSRL